MLKEKSKATSSKAATGRKNKKFKPLVLINIDMLHKRRIDSFYAELIKILNVVLDEVNSLLFNDSKFNIDFLLGLLKQKGTESKKRYIFEHFVQLSGISIPGINTEQLISKGLIDLKIPEQLTDYLERYEKHMSRFDIDRIGLSFPIRKLYRSSGNVGVFVLTEEFDRAVKILFSQETDTEEQNDIYNSIQTIANNLNQLCDLGVLYPNKLEEFLDLTIQFDRFAKTNPFSVSPHLFQRHILKEHAIIIDRQLPQDFFYV